MLTADDAIRLLGLEPHPTEGGFFRETYRSTESVGAEALPGRYGADRRFGTSIYYLLRTGSVSRMHRLASDEVYHFHMGDAVEMLRLRPGGGGEVVTIGVDLEAGERPQVVVPGGVWQGSRLATSGAHGFALMGTTVAPGFEYSDYEDGEGAALSAKWPDFAGMIEALT